MRRAIPRCPSGRASAAIRSGAGGRGQAGGGFENFNFGGGDTADLSDLFEGLFGAATGRGGGQGGGFGGFRQRGRAAQKGADIAYRLKVPFVDAVALKPQRITLGDGKTIDLKLPQGLEDGTKIRLGGKGEEGPAGRGDAIVTIEIAPHRFFTRDGNNIRLDLPVTLKEAVLGAKVKVPTADGPVMLTIPKGTTSGKVLRLKERGFAAKDGKRGDQLVSVEIDVPASDPELQKFAESWNAGGNPRASLEFSAAVDARRLASLAGSTAQAACEHARGLRDGGRGEAQAAPDRVGSDQAGRDRRL